MPKQQWKKCSHCGALTDFDEKECPNRSLENNLHILQLVELEIEEVKDLWKAGRIWTKNVAVVEMRLSQ